MEQPKRLSDEQIAGVAQAAAFGDYGADGSDLKALIDEIQERRSADLDTEDLELVQSFALFDEHRGGIHRPWIHKILRAHGIDPEASRG